MRFYPQADINSYYEIPSSWSLYCRSPLKCWKRKDPQSKHTIAYWRDLEGAKIHSIMDKNLYFSDWPQTRICPEACLAWYYCVGNRFIAVEKAYPAGFKCAKLPLNLKEVRELHDYVKEMAKIKRAVAKTAKSQAKKIAKLKRYKMEQRGELKIKEQEFNLLSGELNSNRRKKFCGICWC